MDGILNIKTLNYKMVVLGHYSVGKSSLVLNFVKGEFNPNEESTIGASFLTKTIFVDKNAIKYEIWDTAGQERYYSLIPMYYRGAQVALIVYDITLRDSFESAKKWIEELKHEKPNDFLKILVANKIDLREEAVVSLEEGKQLANTNNLIFFETSAKTGENIEKMFTEIAKILPKEIKKTHDSVKLKKNRKNYACC